jgi:hypothetical protein
LFFFAGRPAPLAKLSLLPGLTSTFRSRCRHYMFSFFSHLSVSVSEAPARQARCKTYPGALTAIALAAGLFPLSLVGWRWPQKLSGLGGRRLLLSSGNTLFVGEPEEASHLIYDLKRQACMYVCMYVCMDGWMDGWALFSAANRYSSTATRAGHHHVALLAGDTRRITAARKVARRTRRTSATLTTQIKERNYANAHQQSPPKDPRALATRARIAVFGGGPRRASGPPDGQKPLPRQHFPEPAHNAHRAPISENVVLEPVVGFVPPLLGFWVAWDSGWRKCLAYSKHY